MIQFVFMIYTIIVLVRFLLASVNYELLHSTFSVNIFLPFRVAEDLRSFCNSSACPDNLASDDRFHLQCCVWHANIHVCHPNDVCGRTVSEYYMSVYILHVHVYNMW